ncbi:MAG TPA: apolipoprotein N-acyltransferase, partial [Acidimicrobiales bacterium]|nr:apolipoprotein N-acyltransferase [Acidimicrobiales bacterium]
AVALALAAVAPRGEAVGELAVAVVQGGGPQRTRAADTDEREVFERHLRASADVDTPVDLVLWPENVVNVTELATSREADELAELARRLDATLVVGVVEDAGPGRFENAAIVFGPDGAVVDRYDKVRIVPFGEYVPLRGLLERVAGDTLPGKDAVRGEGRARLETPVGDLGVAISWEVFFAGRAREGIVDGGQVLLNPTNGSSYWLTIVQTQQVASSRLRALETGRWVLQAAPTGLSAIVTPEGEVVARSAVSEARVLQATIEQRTGQTWATRLGDRPALVVALALVGAGWALDRRRAATGRPTPVGAAASPVHGDGDPDPDPDDLSPARTSG